MTADLNVPLDIFGQTPDLNIYTQVSLCFPIPGDHDDTQILNLLHSGRERLAASFPWTAGQVINDGMTDVSTGTFAIKKMDPIPPLVYRDYRQDSSVPSYDELRQAEFPMQMLNEAIFAPRSTLTGSSDESLQHLTPVFAIQANFIRGGLIMTFVGQHQAMDMSGQFQVIRLLAQACRNESFDLQEIEIGNRSRHDIIPLLDNSYELGPELDDQMVKLSLQESSGPPAKCHWADFRFTGECLQALKMNAMHGLASGFVSVDDALCALIWRSVVRARLQRLNSEQDVMFARAVNARSYVNVSAAYPGLLQNMAFNHLTASKVIEGSLGSVASSLRSSIDPVTSQMAHRTRAGATHLSRSPDKRILSFTGSMDLGKDLALSSWAKFDFYKLNFGSPLKSPEAVRRPLFTPVEGLIYFLPKEPNGEISVVICLRDEDMERLKNDEEFQRFGVCVK